VVDTVNGQTEPSFRSLMTLRFELADSFMKLHAVGMCYRDINFFYLLPRIGHNTCHTDGVVGLPM
jgi:hypothetical protein